MKLFLMVYWGIAWTTGIACLTGLLFRWSQKREESAKRLMAFMASMAISTAALALHDFLEAGTATAGLLGSLSLMGAGLTVASFPRYAASLDTVERRKRIGRIFLAWGLCLCLLNAVLALLPWRPAAHALGLLTLFSLACATGFALSWMSRSARIREEGKNPKSGYAETAFFFAASGAMIFFDFLNGWNLVSPALGGKVLLFPAFYAYLSVSLFTSHLRFWFRDAGTENAEEEGEAAAAASGRYGISEREAEVIALLAKGRTYREIADELYVSLATIKSHLNHLYTKTDTRNKVELLNRVMKAGFGKP